jgi:hypothetical protein
MDDREYLVRAIRERSAILFVGAGVSMTVGLPSWNTLIEHMADELGVAEATGLRRRDDGGGANALDIGREKMWLQDLSPRSAASL